MPDSQPTITPSQTNARRFRKNRLFQWFCILATASSIIILAVLLTSVVMDGWKYLRPSFLENVSSRKPERTGIYPAIFGTIWVCLTCMITAIPMGIGTAILLEEYKPRNRWWKRLHTIIELNIANLAGVPSIVYGIVGMTVFVHMFNIASGTDQDMLWSIGDEESWYYMTLPFGRSVLAGGLTLMLVVLPIIITTAQESLRAVPDILRHGALGLGATRWQMIRRITLPMAIPGIMTGSILATSRAIGEAAPLLVISGVVYITFAPENLMSSFTVMPLQIYHLASHHKEEFHLVAATGILVLLAILLAFNALAVFIRYKYRKPTN